MKIVINFNSKYSKEGEREREKHTKRRRRRISRKDTWTYAETVRFEFEIKSNVTRNKYKRLQ